MSDTVNKENVELDAYYHLLKNEVDKISDNDEMVYGESITDSSKSSTKSETSQVSASGELESEQTSVYASSEENSETNQNVQSIMDKEESDEGSGAGLDINMSMNKGVAYPIIRINDHYCTFDEIREFYIESGFYKDYNEYKTIKKPQTGFVPTMHLILHTGSPDFLKGNQIKSGDKCAIFFSSGGGMVKSYRGDYIITSVTTSNKETEVTDKPVTYIIKGELYIPNLRNESEKFCFNGSSRDAIMDAAQRLGLSFFFCDPEDTKDYQGWQCYSNLRDYVQDIATHAWKEFDAFYDCWIDTRYGLSFLNMNKLLIADGFDEQIDLTPFVSTINTGRGVDGKKAYKTEEDLKNDTQPQAKILSNIPSDTESTTPFYVKKWKISNRAAEICHAIGINATQTLNIDNAGVSTDVNNIDMKYSIPLNKTKLQNGFFVLIGPGINLTYTQADQIAPEQSFVSNSYKVDTGVITEVMSDGDAEQMKQTGNNMMSSGNTNKFYDAAFEHNMRNNLQLQKQITEVELLGLNLAIMRGEKIPMMIVDYDRMQSSIRSGNFNANDVEYALYEMVSGWYIIDGIKWRWYPDPNTNGTTFWTTEVRLTRREWPIPGRSTCVQSNDSISVVNTAENLQEASSMSAIPNDKTETNRNTNKDSVKNNSQNNSRNGSSDTKTSKTGSRNAGNNNSQSQSVNTGAGSSSGGYTGTSAKSKISTASEDNSGSDMPLTGLKPELKNVYRALLNICPDINLVSAKRWAVDENGNRVEGNAFVKKNGLYKCCNAKGEIMYFKNNDSRHMYGEAFDIINKNGLNFNDILTKYILNDQSFLAIMAENGVALCIEKTTDDCGASTKHYHFGTDEDIQTSWWQSVQAYIPQMSDMLKYKIKNASSAAYRVRSAEIKNIEVEE